MPFWNTLFSLFFVGLTFAALYLLDQTVGVPLSIDLFDLALITLAVFRLTRLVVYDSIMKFFRDWFENAREGTFLGTLRTLVNCPWCMGLWFALSVTFFYFFYLEAWFVILVLAIAGVSSFIQILANWVGWSAEHKKKKVLHFKQD